ncbi:bucentaur or craniofacial development-domain-containing protein [Xylariales sp. AK1849]|nr:bucentaur or craniofacial development-domain-containing protein [Xylariales sp. AK1849]
MATESLIDEDYASEEDSDFAPEDTHADEASEASGSEDDTGPTIAPAKRKCASDDNDANEGYENSGDEAIISKGKKRQKKKDKRKDGAVDDDKGGEGGLIKTRSMRAIEKAERKTAVASGPVTVDVNDIWAQMTAGPVVPSKANVEKEGAVQTNGQDSRVGGDRREMDAPQSERRTEYEPSATIKIKRTYNFAGKVHTEEKLVPRNSAEAKVYLTSLGTNAESAVQADDEAPKRQPRKAFRSIYEPVSESLVQRSDLNLGMSVRLQMREQAKAKKLNVVEKSRMDWAGFVDKEGIKDDLELAGKSKQSFASRQDFLARVEANREEDARRARMAGRA